MWGAPSPFVAAISAAHFFEVVRLSSGTSARLECSERSLGSPTLGLMEWRVRRGFMNVRDPSEP